MTDATAVGWAEDFSEPSIHYGPRREGEAAKLAEVDLVAETGMDPLEYERFETKAIWMRRIEGEEADEFFEGEFDGGWVHCHESHREAKPFWSIEGIR